MKHKYIYLIILGVVIIFTPVFYFISKIIDTSTAELSNLNNNSSYKGPLTSLSCISNDDCEIRRPNSEQDFCIHRNGTLDQQRPIIKNDQLTNTDKGYTCECVSTTNTCSWVPPSKSAQQKHCEQTGGAYYSFDECPLCPDGAVCETCFVGCVCPQNMTWTDNTGCIYTELLSKVLDLPKEDCPCWFGLSNVCLPSTECR